MEAPSDPVTVEPFPAIINPHQLTQDKPTTSRHSRPGPVYGGLEGVFQPSLPASISDTSTISSLMALRFSVPLKLVLTTNELNLLVSLVQNSPLVNPLQVNQDARQDAHWKPLLTP